MNDAAFALPTLGNSGDLGCSRKLADSGQLSSHHLRGPTGGLDIAKHAHEVILRCPSGRTKAMRVLNREADFQQLTQFLLDQGLPVTAAVEPTGDYHRLLAHWLLRHGVPVHLASSLACARVRTVE
jgi:hypothetical protein